MRLKRRALRVGVVTVAIAAVTSGFALAASLMAGALTDADGAYNGCVSPAGTLRVVTPGTSCHQSDTAISWNQAGRGFRMLRATPDEVEVTAVGSGPIGFPTDDAPPTPILTLELPQGVYELSATIEARKAWGNGDLLCWAEYRLPSGSQTLAIFTRASLGTDPGHAMRATVSGGGFVNFSTGGGPVTLACGQASHDAIGSPSGENPTVFYAFLNATTVTRATLGRYPSGTVTEFP